jgi:hypothetical protein
VALPGADWGHRFRVLLGASDVEVVSNADSVDDPQVFARANHRLVEAARALAPEPRALLVWNGHGGDGAGGTRDFVHRLG